MPLNSTQEARKPESLCDEQNLLPVRYALTSEENPPLEATQLKRDSLPELTEYKFTLRTIQTGYIFIYWNGLPDIAVYEVTQRGFSRLTECGYTGSSTIRIPKDQKKFYIRYLRIYAIEHTNGGEPLWKLAAKNLKADMTTLMQEVDLNDTDNNFHAPLPTFKRYVEEFRSKPGYLAYLPCWGENVEHLHFSPEAMPHKVTDRHKRWKASSEEMTSEKGVEPFCAETRLVALYDCVGNLLDCVAIHAKSAQAIVYFQQWHAPLVYTSLLIDGVVEKRKQRVKAEWQQERARRHAASVRAMNDPRRLAMATCHGQQSVRHDEEVLRMRMEEDIARNPCPVEKGTSNADFLKKLDSDIALDPERETYLIDLTNRLTQLRNSMEKLITDWTRLLSHDDKKYSLKPTLLQAFKSEDQSSSSQEKFAEPLTLSRGKIFSACHIGIADMDPYLPSLKDLFKNNKVYSDLWKEVMGKGGVPEEEFSVWLHTLLPFVGFQAKNGTLNDGVLTQILDVCANRLHVTSPTQNRRSKDIGYLFTESLVFFSGNDSPTESQMYELGELIQNPAVSEKILSDGLNPIPAMYLEHWSRGTSREAFEGTLAKAEEELTQATSRAERAGRKLDRYLRHLEKLKSVTPVWHSKSKAGTVKTRNQKNWQKKEKILAHKVSETKRITQKQQRLLEEITRTSKVDALNQGIATLSLMASTANLAVMAKEISALHSKGQSTKEIVALLKMTPSIMSFITEVRQLFLQQAARKLFLNTYIAVSGAGVVADLFDMISRSENMEAFISGGIADFSGMALVLLPRLVPTLGMLIPAAGVLMLLFVGGTILYIALKDDEEVAFLKNNLWSNTWGNFDNRAIKEGLKNGKLDEEKVKIINNSLLPTPKIWQNAKSIVEEHLSLFSAPAVTIGLDKQALYVSIRAWRLSSNDILDITLSIYGTSTWLNGPITSQNPASRQKIGPEFLIRDAIETGAPQYLLFEAYFDMIRIREYINGLFMTHFIEEMECVIEMKIGDFQLAPQRYVVNTNDPWINPTKEAIEKLRTATWLPVPEDANLC